MDLDALADGDHDDIRRDALFAALGLFGRGAPFIRLADDLRLHHSATAWPFASVSMREGPERQDLQPSAMAPATSSGRAVISSMRRR